MMSLKGMKESTGPLSRLSIFLLLLFSSLVRSAPSFKSVGILLNCGASSNAIDADKRRWTNDSSALFGPSNPQSSFSAQASHTDLSLLPSLVPYETARIFTSASSYNFSALPSGRHFVRLHFYPAVYNDRDTKNAFFSVTTESYTLLRNFSSAITASALKQAYIMREYFINVPSSGSLILTFTPSPNNPNSFAFVNGIEIVSSPQLFLSDAFTVPTHLPLPIRDSDALQTVVRLNVGGNYVSPTADSGLTRTWYNDTPNLFGDNYGVSFSRDNNVSIRYSDAIPDYIAPPDVYGTARSMGPDTIVNMNYAIPDYIAPPDVYGTAPSMGPNVSVNMNYNLTWLLTVDSGFRYLIRLHFCEIQSKFYEGNQRVFDVYVNNMTADTGLDVILYAKIFVQASPYTGVAVYNDYMLIVPPSSSKQIDFLIELHPDIQTRPQYAGAILNGLEVFKINGSSGNLAGPNPDLPPWPSVGKNNTSINHQQAGDRRRMIAGVLGGTAAAFVVSVCFYCLLCKCHQKEQGSKGAPSFTWMQLSPYVQEKNRKSPKSSVEMSKAVLNTASNVHCRYFVLAEIIAATNNFDDALLLGIGGFGKVYKGEIDGGLKVAIKRGNQLSEQGLREFTNEIEILSTLRHRHLVSLIGYCDDNSEMILVYKYMARGTLRQHLYGANQPPLSWRRRLEICISAAKGLHYLHAGAAYTLIHRDVKTTNILLDENWVAKVSDFGLSRMGTSLDCSHVSTGVKGTFGYFDPEYFRLHRLTDKSDVYSFGVVMLELLCARPPVDKSRSMEQIGLSDWALNSMREGRMEQIIDPFLKGEIMEECLHRFAETAEKCLAEKGVERPSMATVVSSLEIALSLQISAEQGNKEEELAHSYYSDGNEYDFGSSMSSEPCQTDEGRSRSVVDERAIYEIESTN